MQKRNTRGPAQQQSAKLGGGFSVSQPQARPAAKPGTASQTSAPRKAPPVQQDPIDCTNPGLSAFMKRPKTLVCYICGREYGTKSLKIHLRTCEQKWYIEQDQKPAKQRKDLPKAPPGLLELLEKDNITMKDISNYNNRAFEQYNYEALEQCVACGRTFKPESLIIHQKSCKPGKPLKPLTVSERPIAGAPQRQQSLMGASNAFQSDLNLVPCRKCGRKFVADRIQVHEGACKGNAPTKKALQAQKQQQMKQLKYNRYESVHGKPQSKWRQQHEELVTAMREMRKYNRLKEQGREFEYVAPPSSQQANQNLVPCPFCNRRFNDQAAERHIKICKNVINKPKPVGGHGYQQQLQQSYQAPPPPPQQSRGGMNGRQSQQQQQQQAAYRGASSTFAPPPQQQQQQAFYAQGGGISSQSQSLSRYQVGLRR